MTGGTSGLPEVVDAVRRRWLLALSVAVPVMLGVLGVTSTLPSTYEAKAVVALEPRTPGSVGADIIRVTIPKYVAYLTSTSTVREVAGQLGLAASGLASSTDVAIETDTSVLSVTVTRGTAAEAAEVANAFAAAAIAYSSKDALIEGTLVSPAVPPSQPAGPPRRLFQASGLLFSLIAGVGAAFVSERGSPRVRTVADVTRATELPVVGRLPRSTALRRNLAEALSDPHVGAAVRQTRAFLDAELRGSPLHVLAVTSPQAGDGKTSATVTLANTIARLDAKVLLADADLRRPRAGAALGITAKYSLADVLRGEVGIQDAAVPTGIPGLSIVTGAVDADAGDLLPRGLPGFLARAQEVYDIIVIDCPPLLGGEDASTIATMADATLLVVSIGTPTRKLTEAMLILEALRVRALGVVLNRVRPGNSYYSSKP